MHSHLHKVNPNARKSVHSLLRGTVDLCKVIEQQVFSLFSKSPRYIFCSNHKVMSQKETMLRLIKDKMRYFVFLFQRCDTKIYQKKILKVPTKKFWLLLPVITPIRTKCKVQWVLPGVQCISCIVLRAPPMCFRIYKWRAKTGALGTRRL